MRVDLIKYLGVTFTKDLQGVKLAVVRSSEATKILAGLLNCPKTTLLGRPADDQIITRSNKVSLL